MECKVSQTKLVEYYYQELSQEESNRLREHLLLCPVCQKEFTDLVKILDNFEVDSNIEKSTEFWVEFREKVWQKVSLYKLWGNSRAPWQILNPLRLLSAIGGGLFVLLIIFTSIKIVEERQQVKGADTELAQEWELIENFDLINDIELIEDINVVDQVEG